MPKFHLQKILDSTELTQAEKDCYMFLHSPDQMGSFTRPLWEALFHADGHNLARLFFGFPDEVIAKNRYTNENLHDIWMKIIKS